MLGHHLRLSLPHLSLIPAPTVATRKSNGTRDSGAIRALSASHLLCFCLRLSCFCFSFLQTVPSVFLVHLERKYQVCGREPSPFPLAPMWRHGWLPGNTAFLYGLTSRLQPRVRSGFLIGSLGKELNIRMWFNCILPSFFLG